MNTNPLRTKKIDVRIFLFLLASVCLLQSAKADYASAMQEVATAYGNFAATVLKMKNPSRDTILNLKAQMVDPVAMTASGAQQEDLRKLLPLPTMPKENKDPKVGPR